MSDTLRVQERSYPPSTRGEWVLDQIFPPLCVGCRRMGRWVCERCWHSFPWLPPDYPIPLPRHLDAVEAVAEHDGVAREAVLALKFGERHAIARMMGRLMAETASSREIDVVIPVPLHPSRKRERGYDQAAMLATHLAGALNRPSRSKLLRRTRKTRQQTSLDGIHRQENVRDAFAPRERLHGETVLLVDDVLTTGATLSAAAHAARDAGAGKVIGCVFAWAR